MLRRSSIVSVTRSGSRYFHSSIKLRKEEKSNISGNKEYEDQSTVDSAATQIEQNLYNSVFERVKQKQNLRKKQASSSFILDHFFSGNEEKQNPHIIFGGESKAKAKSDQNLVDYLTGRIDSESNLSSFKSTNLRKYPVSLTSTSLLDEDTASAQNVIKDLKDNLKNVNTVSRLETPQNLKLVFNKKTLEEITIKEKFKGTLELLLKPYMDNLIEAINDDHDLLVKAEQLLKLYENRDKKWDNRESGEVKVILDHLKTTCTDNPTELPQPYRVSLPYVIVKLLERQTFEFSTDRLYRIITYIYNYCKSSPDVTLYLNVCNVDFYNSLLSLSWESYSEIKQIRHITSEMKINGIFGDISTIEKLNKIVGEAREFNDNIPTVDELGKIQKKYNSVSVVWDKDSPNDLRMVEIYLRDLKERLTN